MKAPRPLPLRKITTISKDDEPSEFATLGGEEDEELPDELTEELGDVAKEAQEAVAEADAIPESATMDDEGGGDESEYYEDDEVDEDDDGDVEPDDEDPGHPVEESSSRLKI